MSINMHRQEVHTHENLDTGEAIGLETNVVEQTLLSIIGSGDGNLAAHQRLPTG